MHHKFAIFDGTRLVNGSYNWTRGAADLNYENLVESADPWLLATFASLLGLWTSYLLDLPTGAAVVCACGLLLAIVGVVVALRRPA